MTPNLNFKVFGEGEPVVILHGLFGMLDNWQTFAKALSKDYMVYIIDQRDHGKSEHTSSFNYSILAEDLKAFLEEQWIYEARFIGHSMGGKTMLQFASQYEDLIQQMMIVDIGTKPYVGGHEVIIEALKKVDIDNISLRKQAEETIAETVDDNGVIQFLLKNLSRRKEGGYRWKMNLDLLQREYQNILAGISFTNSVDCDTLFVRGSKSNYIQDDDLQGLEETFTQMQLQTLDAGHWLHAEKPEELLLLTQGFFDK